MSYPTRHHLKKDGFYRISPAFHGRNYYGCFRLTLGGRRLNHSNSAPNPLRLNILPTSPTGSIFCADFRLSPPVFSIFYGQGGRGEGGARPVSPRLCYSPVATVDSAPECHNPYVRILISAGEASGELYGAQLIEALRQEAARRLPQVALQFFGVGGEHMQRAGCELVVNAH